MTVTGAVGNRRNVASTFGALTAVIGLAALVGIWTRPVGWLSSFWIANALLLGVFIRLPRLRTTAGWAGAACGFMAADLVTGGPLLQTMWLTVANLSGVVAGVVVLGRRPHERRLLQEPHGVLEMLMTCAVTATAATIPGTYCGVHYFGLSTTDAVTTWFSAEFASYLALLPVILTAPTWARWRVRVANPLRRLDDRRRAAAAAAPIAGVVAALLLGIAVDGPAALAFSIPVLLWSATRGDVFQTACLVLLATAWNLTAAGLGFLDLRYEASASDHLLSAQISMSLTAMGPLMVAASSRSRERRIREWEGLATHDELTGVLSRRGFLGRAAADVLALRAQRAPCAVLMLDLDHFKALNDRFGHAAGDDALVSFATQVAGRVRESDAVGRLGGEEFAVLLQRLTRDQAVAIADDIRRTTELTEIVAGGATTRVTVSIGVAHVDAAGPDVDLTGMLLRADRALYIAKRDRNRVVVDDG